MIVELVTIGAVWTLLFWEASRSRRRKAAEAKLARTAKFLGIERKYGETPEALLERCRDKLRAGRPT